ncbi:Putative metallopeptidase domain containing protein [Oxalobacteraceae bacterium]
MISDQDNLLQSATLKIRAQSPFFGTLILFAQLVRSLEIQTAATDGVSIFYNPDFIVSLKRGELEAVLLHEVLHCALLHGIRRGSRDPERWNIAADIVVNGMIAQQNSFTLPEGALRDEKLEMLPTEEVYELLPKDATLPENLQDLLLTISVGEANPGSGEQSGSEGVMGEIAKRNMSTLWRNAMQQAQTIAHGNKAGWVPLGFQREFNELSVSRINWKAELWRYLIQTPTDFTGFDRRFIGQGLYLDSLQGDSLDVDVIIDTSGSIDEELLSQFLAEIKAILRAYPHIRCRLFYADCDLYGPYDLSRNSEIPKPEGGGGTSFIPYFEFCNQKKKNNKSISIYLTDGYGDFPEDKPQQDVLWVISPGGLAAVNFPFGKVINARVK